MTKIRERYIDGDLFKIGDIVIHKDRKSIHEVVDLGTNYLTVINEKGDIIKMWLEHAVLANELKEDFDDLRRKRSSSSQIAFVGYKTSNFNQEIYEAFKQTLANKNAKKEKFLVLNAIRQTDGLLESIKELDKNSYQKIKSLFEQTEKYLDKIDSLCYHTYRAEIKDSLNEFEISEGIVMTAVSKERAVQILVDSLGVEPTVQKSLEEQVNDCALVVKQKRLTTEAWNMVGKMFNQMTMVGIKWDKDIFSKQAQLAMKLK